MTCPITNQTNAHMAEREADLTVEQMQDRIDELEQERDEANKHVASLSRLIDTLANQDVVSLARQVEDLQARLFVKDVKITELTGDVEDMHGQVEELTKERDSLSDSFRITKAGFDAADKERDIFSDQIEELTGRCNDLLQENDRKYRVLEDVCGQNKRLREQVETLKAALREVAEWDSHDVSLHYEKSGETLIRNYYRNTALAALAERKETPDMDFDAEAFYARND